MIKHRNLMLGALVVIIFLFLFIPSCATTGENDKVTEPQVEIKDMTVFIYKFEKLAGARPCDLEITVTIEQNGRKKTITGVNQKNIIKFDNADINSWIDFNKEMKIWIEVTRADGDCSPLKKGTKLGPLTVTMEVTKSNGKVEHYRVKIDTAQLGKIMLKLGLQFGW